MSTHQVIGKDGEQIVELVAREKPEILQKWIALEIAGKRMDTVAPHVFPLIHRMYPDRDAFQVIRLWEEARSVVEKKYGPGGM